MIEVAALVAFGTAAGLLAYTGIGFPALLAVAGRLLDRRVQRADVTPSLTLVIAAYNEQACIAERLENALAADYPADRLEILVASDGSTDDTDRIVASFAPRGVRLLALPRRGKIFALADAARAARGEILVFSDANTHVEPGALRALAQNFADPAVGGVVGHTGYRLERTAESAGRGESLYWRYDTRLKELESRTGSVVSAHGGLYAIRRELFEAPLETAVTDDFIISTGVVARGYRLVFERNARAWEAPVATSGGEFRRRVRLMTRGLRAVSERRALLDPRRYGFYSVVLFSHKVVRRLVPLALILLFLSSAALAGHAFFRWLLLAQAAFYALALAGYVARASRVGGHKLLYAPFFFCLANLAALAALGRFLRGDRITRWEPQRHGAAAGGAPVVRVADVAQNGAAAAAGDLLVAGVVRVRAVNATAADVRRLEAQLGSERAAGAGPADITVRFVDRLARRGMQHVEVGRSGFDADGYLVRAGGGSAWARVPFAAAGGACEFVCERSARSVPLLLPFVQLAATARGYLPFHASGFEWAGRGVLVAGWSRGGKTSALLSFGGRGARYVGDDLVLLAGDGSVMRGIASPLALSEWHLAQLPGVRRAAPVGKRILGAAVQRMSEAAHAADAAGGGGVAEALRLRTVVRVGQRSTKVVVPLRQLFGGVATDDVAPRKLFLMMSADQPHVTVALMPVAAIAERMRHSLAAEAQPLVAHYHAYRFAAAGPPNPFIEQLDQRQAALMDGALARLDGHVVQHPYPAPFEALFSAMQPWCES